MIKRLGDIASFRRGLTYSKGDEAPLSNKRVLRSNNIDLESSSLDLSEIKYLREDFIIPDDRKLVANSIFICMSNGSKQHVGKVAFIPEDMDYAFGGFMGLIVPSSEVSAKYVFYACQSSAYRSFLSQVGNGIGITNLRFSDLEKFEFPVPSLADQQRIVDELDLLSGIVEKKNAQLRTLDELASTIFYEMFGDPVSNDRNWPTARMNDVAPQKVYAGAISAKDGKYWLLNLDMVESQTGRVVEKALFSPAEIRNSTTTFNEDNVLYSKLRPYLNKVVLPDEPGYCTSELVPLLPKKGVLNRIYLTYLLRSKFFVDYINARVAGAKMPRVTMSDFREFDVILPPIAFQESFAARIIAIDKQKKIINDSIPPAKDLLLSRIDKYFC